MFDVFNNTKARFISTVSVVELSIVLTHRLGAAGPAAARLILTQGSIEEVGLDHEQARLASQGFLAFGKGQHPAALNFGDCFVYELAASLNLPVVCLGNDFPQTDLETIHPD